MSPKRSYERIFQINRDNERKWFFPELFKEDDEEDNTEAEEKEKNKKKRKYNSLDSDIEFGEREQEFFKKSYQKQLRWVLYGISKRAYSSYLPDS